MTASLAHIRHAIERRLYTMGFALPVARHLLCTQIIISGLALTAGIILLWYSLWPLAFGAGATITTFSLWQISRSAQALVQQQYSTTLGLRQFIGFSARLLFIGIVFFALIVWLKVPLAPLLLGLTSTVASILLWGVSRISRKTVKET
jgi:hypothetical protein